MFRRKKINLFDTGAEGDPKRIFLDVLFVITGPLIIMPYSMVFGVIWTVLAAIFLIMDVVTFVRIKRQRRQGDGERQIAEKTADQTQQEKRD